ncbi:PIN domain-containing protein [Candidatus Saccharibacteria bacterium]|nr:PIN domain-containing protein [Candidatus Saccharibacteria bacterium]
MKSFRWALLDTNVILRLALGDNREQAYRALDLVTANGKFFVAPDMAIYEAAYVLGSQYGYGRKKIIEILKTVLSQPRIDYNHEVFDIVFEEFPKHPKLSFADCYMCALGKSKEWSFFTFDEKLTKQCEMALVVPENISQDE